MALRPYWKGNIRLSLVSLPVSIYAALNRSKQIPLHEIYRKTGERVHNQLMAGDAAIDRDDIVKGYEVEKGEYVLIEPEDIQDLKIPSSRTLDIVEFVNADAIDELYFETPYFVVPDARQEDTFAVIRDALRETGKIGIGQLAIGGRERLCSLKPCGSGIILETLRYEDEVRKSDPYFGDAAKAKVPDEELDLAKELIKRKSAKFDAAKFHDHYREALKELIDARVEHRAPKPVETEKPTAKVVNLMDALRESLKAQRGTAEERPRPKLSRRRKAG